MKAQVAFERLFRPDIFNYFCAISGVTPLSFECPVRPAAAAKTHPHSQIIETLVSEHKSQYSLLFGGSANKNDTAYWAGEDKEKEKAKRW